MIDLDKLNILLEGQGIEAKALLGNSKASEYYVRVTFIFPKEKWDAVVPYIYRRSNLSLKNENEIAEYLIKIKPYFSMKARKEWVKREWSKWEERRAQFKNPEKFVTYGFFKTLISLKEEVSGFPENPNPQRRLQDIKDEGYTVSIYPVGNMKWGKMLLPLPLHAQMGYEVFTPQFKARVIRLFNGINAYEAKPTAHKSLIPDHKFSEVRWDDETKAENPMTMTDEEIIEKFQLLDNQRNQQKREVCRICYQTGERGRLFGINFYPVGGPKWDDTIPQKGKAAERGCIGCPWYDIEAWRKALNDKLKKKNGRK